MALGIGREFERNLEITIVSKMGHECEIHFKFVEAPMVSKTRAAKL